MVKRLGLIAFLVIGCVGVSVGQLPKVCEPPNTYFIDNEKPSVYLEFEQFGKASDWTQSRLGELSGKAKIEKGKDVWLRLHNNSCWDIKIPTFSLYVSRTPDTANPGQFKIAFQIQDGAAANVFYNVEEQDRKGVSWGGDSYSISVLRPGQTVIFPVFREHLEKSRSIYVNFNYEWEKKQFSNNLDPLHRSFFWGYRLEEAKGK